MMCAQFLKAHQHEAGRVYTAAKRFDWMLKAYGRPCAGCCATRPHPGLPGVTIGITVYLYIVVPKGFFPEQDTGRLAGRYGRTGHLLRGDAGKDALHGQDPSRRIRVSIVTPFVGGSGGGGTNTAAFHCSSRIGRRKVDRRGVIKRLRRKLRIFRAQLFMSRRRTSTRRPQQRAISVHAGNRESGRA